MFCVGCVDLDAPPLTVEHSAKMPPPEPIPELLKAVNEASGQALGPLRLPRHA